MLLDQDEARLRLFQAIGNIAIGNKTDDKLILEELRKLGFWVCRLPAAQHEGEREVLNSGWDPIEKMVDQPIWVLKYDIYFATDGNFCGVDHPEALKFTSCHGWYETEADALTVQRHFPNPAAYQLERVHRRVLFAALARTPEPSTALDTMRERERIARAIYEVNPCGDQETDADGRPLGPGYVIPFETLAEYDSGLYALVFEQADAVFAALASAPEPSAPGTIAEACDKIEQYIADYHAAKYPSDAWVPNLTNMIACRLSDIRGMLTAEPSARVLHEITAAYLETDFNSLHSMRMSLTKIDKLAIGALAGEPPSAAVLAEREQKLVEALEKCRIAIVMGLAFLGRDQGTSRIDRTIDGLCKEFAEADEVALSALRARTAISEES